MATENIAPVKSRKNCFLCLIAILATLILIGLLQTPVRAEATSASQPYGSATHEHLMKPRSGSELSSLPTSYVIGGASPYCAESAATSGYPASHMDMVYRVPFFYQTGDTCGAYSMKQVLWWFGRMDVQVSDIHMYLHQFQTFPRDEGPYWIWDMELVLIHWLGNDDRANCDASYGGCEGDGDAREIAKSWICGNTPVICCISVGWTGSPPVPTWHYVTLIGYDDAEGCWILHDTLPHFRNDAGGGYNVHVSYDSFANHWGAQWTTDPFEIYNQFGMVTVCPGDQKYPAPSAGISDETHGNNVHEGIEDITDSETLRLGVWLHNSEGPTSDYASSNPKSQGVFVRLDGAEIVSVDVRDQTQWFKSYMTYDEQENEIPTSGAKIIEFYTDDFAYHGPPHTVGAYVTVQPTRLGEITVYYRGWMRDAEDIAREHMISVDDDSLSCVMPLAELYIVRSPPDIPNDRDNFLDYPTASKTCLVIDDDTEGPTIRDHIADKEIYDNSNDDIGCGAWITDLSGVSDVQIDYWYDAPDPTYRTTVERWFDGYLSTIPRSEWINHVGSNVYYHVHAQDGDNDWPPYYDWVWVGDPEHAVLRWQLVTDTAGTTSPVYLGWTILDDDVEGPLFCNPSSAYDDATGDYRIQIDSTDQSGIYEVRFKVKLGDSWSDWHAPSGSSGSTYWYEIPKEQWIPHVGETLYWVADAVDNDNDRPGDAAGSQSAEYPATLAASSLIITGESPINILATDPGGLRVGCDPVLGVLNEILGASYSGSGTEPQEIRIPIPVEGKYRIDVFGTGTGAFTITVESFAADGSLINSRTWTGTAESGEQYSQEIQVEPSGAVKDATPPITDVTLDGALGLNGWYTSSVIVTLKAIDDMSGVAATQYSLDNIAWISYSGSFTIEDDGTYTLHFWSVDNDGNTETSRTISFKIDTTPPSVAMKNPPSGYALQDGVTFIAAATDIGSGVNSAIFSIREDNGGNGIPVGFEDILGIHDPTTGNWKLSFDTLQLQDGYYVVVVKATDNAGNAGSIKAPYSIRNWAIIELLPSTAQNKAGRTMPVKFSLRIAAAVDPSQPFVYNEELTITICTSSNPSNILRTSTYGTGATDYRIDVTGEKYITNFKTLKTPKQYTISVYRSTFLIGSFNFQTVR